MSLTLKVLTLLGVIVLLHLTESANEPTPVQSTATALSAVLGSKQYYIGVLQKVNWYRAAQICAARGMTLTSIESETESKNLRNYLYLNDVSTSSFWLSGTDLALKGEYTWLATGNRFSYTKWAAGQPSTNVNYRCVQTDASFNWFAASCSSETYFVCSKPVVPDCGAYGTCLYTYNPYL